MFDERDKYMYFSIPDHDNWNVLKFFFFFVFYTHTSIVYRMISHINYGREGLKKPFQAFTKQSSLK